MNKIIWLTGHSESGKTTIAKGLAKEIKAIILDGNEMRKSISLDEGFSREERTEHNFKVARLAKVLVGQTNIIVSVIAPIKEVREEISKICSPIWIYIKRNVPEREGHFYEPSDNYFFVDSNNVKKNINSILKYLRRNKNEK